MHKRAKDLLGFVVAGLLVGTLSGCMTPPTAISDTDATPPVGMQLMQGDEVEINFFGAPELNITQRIRRDGRIALRLTTEMVAAGKTVSELERELVNRYKGQIQVQSISVIVRTGPSVFVSGAVLQPGRVEITRPTTVLDAVMAVGGFDMEKAEKRSVVVIRNEGQKYRGYCLDMRPALAGEGRAFYLYPNDIVYVPATTIVGVNRWVEQYINRMLPRLGIGYGSNGDMTIYR